jgi:hypothetical protein
MLFPQQVASFLIRSVLCLWIVLGPATAGAFSRVLVVPWGHGDSEVAHEWKPGGRYGPSDFVIASAGPEGGPGSFLYLLDREQQRVQCFDLATGVHVAASPVPQGSERLAISRGPADGRPGLVVWDGAALLEGPWGGPFTAIGRPAPAKGVRRLIWQGDQLVMIGHDGSRQRLLAPGVEQELQNAQDAQDAQDDEQEPWIHRSGRSGLVLGTGSQELLRTELGIELGAVQYLGSIAGRHLVLTEEVLSHSPIMARELVLVLQPEDPAPVVVKIPYLYFTYFPDRIRVVGDALLVWISAPDGLHLYAADAEDIVEGRLQLPHLAGEPYHYNLHHPPTPPAEWVGAAMGQSGGEEGVSRATMMEVAEQYAAVEWTATPANITDGGSEPIYCPHGDHLIRTPQWVTPGPKVSMPYKWGGFTDVETFVAGVPAGKYCGDNLCSRSAPYHVCYGDTYTLGVDCSGFVSRCWGTHDKYSTSTLVTISGPLGSVHELLRGDCLNLAGSHVRLVAENNPSGPVLVVEASGADWRVSYRSYTLTSLSGYVPRRFHWVVEDAQGPQPRVPSGRHAPRP